MKDCELLAIIALMNHADLEESEMAIACMYLDTELADRGIYIVGEEDDDDDEEEPEPPKPSIRPAPIVLPVNPQKIIEAYERNHSDC